MIAKATLSASLVAGLALATACDPFVFDDLQDQTWVKSVDKPSGMGSEEFAVGIVRAATGDGTGAHIVAAGDSPAALGAINVSASGDIDSGGATIRDLGTASAIELETGVFAVPTPVAGAHQADVPEGSVAVGLPAESSGAGRVIVVDATLAANPTIQRAFSPVTGVSELGSAVAFADAGLDGAGLELFAAGTTALVMWSDAVTADMLPAPQTCTVDREQIYALHGADVSDANAGEEILVTGGDLNLTGGAAGQVFVTTGQNVADTVAANDGGRCFDDSILTPRAPVLTLDAPGGEADFGAVIISGDFNDNADVDVAIAAPSANVVYVYLDLDADAAAPTPITIAGPSGSVAFGTALAAGDINGGGDELVIGDPLVTVDGESNAGTAYLFEHDGGDFTQRAALHDAQPESGQQFARSVGVIPFGGSDNIIAVGAASEVFVYFQTPLAGDADVRQ